MFLAPQIHTLAFLEGPGTATRSVGTKFNTTLQLRRLVSVGSSKHATRFHSSTSFLSSRFEPIVKISTYEFLCRTQALLNSR